MIHAMQSSAYQDVMGFIAVGSISHSGKNQISMLIFTLNVFLLNHWQTKRATVKIVVALTRHIPLATMDHLTPLLHDIFLQLKGFVAETTKPYELLK